MISFIVIGRNEGKYLAKCFSSINKTIKLNQILKSEIIYIDSDSIDNTMEIVESFKNVIVYKIKGNINAAIARNIGAEESKGETLCFIDGDMELIPENFSEYFNNDKLIGGDYLTGDYYNYIYQNDVLISKDLYHDIKEECYNDLSGGLFFINRNLWLNNNGMRTCFRRSQDYDFSIRMAKLGKKILFKPIPIVLHHTVSYNYLRRFNKDLLSGNFFYQVLLIKYNLFNKHIIPVIMREITLILLILSITLTLTTSKFIFLSIYFLTIFLKLIYKKRINKLIKYLYIYITLDICGVFSLLIFWPRNIKKTDYQIVEI